MRSRKPEQVTLLPDPPRARRHLPIISTDDHLVEPPEMFDGRLPAKFAEQAPRVIDHEGGGQAWLYDGQREPDRSGWPRSPVARSRSAPTNRCASTRCGAASWDVDARVHDMDLDGVYASVCFPSAMPGFCGHRSAARRERSASSRCAVTRCRRTTGTSTRWAGAHPDRFVPVPDPVVARSRGRGRRDPPQRGAWLQGDRRSARTPNHSACRRSTPATGIRCSRACEETETVVCLHVGSSGATPTTSSDAPGDCIGVLFFGFAMFAAVDWLYSKIPVRFPDIKLCLSEGGIGWVAGLLDRLDHVGKYQAIYGTWEGIDLTPREVMQRNFWFCSLEDDVGLRRARPRGRRPRDGRDRLPAPRRHVAATRRRSCGARSATCPRATAEKIAWRNAAEAVPPPGARRRRRRPDPERCAERSGG